MMLSSCSCHFRSSAAISSNNGTIS
jgi:hypothetical protein